MLIVTLDLVVISVDYPAFGTVEVELITMMTFLKFFSNQSRNLKKSGFLNSSL